MLLYMEMSWAYIAGFFDGEGCLHAVGDGMAGQHKFSITICQADDIGKQVLTEIRNFLQDHGINAFVAAHAPTIYKKKPHWKQCWNLWIRQQRSIRLFIEGVYPYLRVKKQRAEDYRRLCILSQNASGLMNESQIKLRRDTLDRLISEGKTIRQIATITGVHYDTVWCKMKRLGYLQSHALPLSAIQG